MMGLHPTSVKENYKDGKKDGIREVYREDGRLFSRESYKNGKLMK